MHGIEQTIAPNKLKKHICLFLTFGIIALLAFCLLLHMSIGRVVTYTPQHLGNQDLDVRFNVNSILTRNNYLYLSGFAFIPNENIETYRIHILLRNVNSNQHLKLPTIMRIQPEITAHYYHETGLYFNYDMSGWLSKVSLNRLNLAHEQFEIIILYQNNNNYVLVNTGIFL